MTTLGNTLARREGSILPRKRPNGLRTTCFSVASHLGQDRECCGPFTRNRLPPDKPTVPRGTPPPASSRGARPPGESGPLGPARARLQDWPQLRTGRGEWASGGRLPGGMWGPSRRVGPRRSTWNSFHPPIPAVSPAGLSRARWGQLGHASKTGPSSGRAAANGLPVDGCEAACGARSRRAGPRRSTWNSFHPPIPAVSPAGLSRAHGASLGHASASAGSRPQDGGSPASTVLPVGGCRRRVGPAAGVPGRGATWNSFRLLVPGLALLGGRVHEAVPAALPQRVSSRSLRTGATRPARASTGDSRGRPPATVWRARSRAPGRGVPRGTPSIPMFPRVSPSGCGVRLPGAGTQPTRRQLLVTGPTAAGRAASIAFAPRSCGGFGRRVTGPAAGAFQCSDGCSTWNPDARTVPGRPALPVPGRCGCEPGPLAGEPVHPECSAHRGRGPRPLRNPSAGTAPNELLGLETHAPGSTVDLQPHVPTRAPRRAETRLHRRAGGSTEAPAGCPSRSAGAVGTTRRRNVGD